MKIRQSTILMLLIFAVLLLSACGGGGSSDGNSGGGNSSGGNSGSGGTAPPGAPTGLTVTAGNAQVALSWTAVFLFFKSDRFLGRVNNQVYPRVPTDWRSWRDGVFDTSG